MRRACTVSIWLMCVFLLACVAARATTLKRMSVAEMTRAAELVVRVRCIASVAGWDAGEIWTLATFEVEEGWKGTPPTQIAVRLLGGTVGNLTSSVDGVPHFHTGEEVVLFLEPTRRGDYSIVSWMQGTFRIGRERATGRECATQDTTAFATFDPVTRRFVVNGIRNQRIEDLRAEVDRALNEKAARSE